MKKTSTRPTILVCDDEDSYRIAIRRLLQNDYDVKTVQSVAEARALLKNQLPQILLLDVNIDGEADGLDAIPIFKNLHPEVTIVVTSGMTDIEILRRAMQLGASDFLPKSASPDEILLSLQRAASIHQLEFTTRQQISETKKFHKNYQLTGESASTQRLMRIIEKVKESDANVLIVGETGTGKEVVARLLRKEREDGSLEPFASVDSSTISSNLAESILFGHEKGAFTGADQERKGIFEEANGGIVFFDEIGNMPMEIQSKLLRVLQEKEVTRLGSSRVIPLEFRVIAATNRKLEDLVAEGKFKEDLFQRLAVIPIHTAPLRERREDIPLLVNHFLQKQNSSLIFSEDCLKALQAYSWPGNVRELQNTVAYVCTFCEQDEVEIFDLPDKIRNFRFSRSQFKIEVPSDESFYDRVSQFEAEILKKEYEESNGNVSLLAHKLKMDRSHLYTKLKAYEIHPVKDSSRKPRALAEVSS